VPLPQPSAKPAKPYRDATGATLADHKQPSMAVNTAVLTLAPRSNPGSWPSTSSDALFGSEALVGATFRQQR
jgi:hypothetical protein